MRTVDRKAHATNMRFAAMPADVVPPLAQVCSVDFEALGTCAILKGTSTPHTLAPLAQACSVDIKALGNVPN